LSHRLLDLRALARHAARLAGRRRPLDVSTTWRWVTRGVRGVVLPSRRIGALTLVDLADFHKWTVDVGQRQRREPAPAIAAPTVAKHDPRDLAALEAAGILPPNGGGRRRKVERAPHRRGGRRAGGAK